MSNDNLVPTAIEAEQALLGSLLIDPYAVERVLSVVSPRDFYRETHRWIYEACLSLYEARTPIDFISACQALERQDRLDRAGGAAYLTHLMSGTPTSTHAEYYAAMVREKSRRRVLIQAGADVTGYAYDEATDIDTLMDRAESRIMEATERTRTGGLLPLGAGLMDLYARLTDLQADPHAFPGVPSGIPDLDKMLGGFQPSDLVLMAARPGLGKTSMLLSVADHAARRGTPVAVFSLEMSRLQLTQRFMSMTTGIDLHRLRMGRLWHGEDAHISEGMGVLDGLPIAIDDTPGLSILQLRAAARRAHAANPLGLVIVDYIQLMSGGETRAENRVHELSRISQGLKTLARELNVPVIAASQLSRAVEGRDNKRPQLSDLRDSGSLEQDSDIVIGLYREDYYKPLANPPSVVKAECLILKHRNGPTGTVEVGFKREQARYVGLDGAATRRSAA